MSVLWGTVKDADGEDGEGEGLGVKGKLLVGMQIVGKRWDEGTLFRAAAAWEVGDWGLDEEN